MKLRLLARSRLWSQSLHAKLFVLTALVTSFITVMVAISIVRNYRRQIESYSKQLALDASQAEAVEQALAGMEHALGARRKL